MRKTRWSRSRSVRRDSIPSTRAMTTTDSVDRLADRSSRISSFFFTNWEYNPVGNVTSSTACAPTAAGYTMLAADSSVNATNLLQFKKYVPAAEAQAPLPNGSANCPATSAIGANGQFRSGDVGFSGSYYNNYFTTVNSVDWNISEKGPVPSSLSVIESGTAPTSSDRFRRFGRSFRSVSRSSREASTIPSRHT